MSRYSQFRNPLFEYGQLELEEELENEFADEGENEFINEIIQSFRVENINYSQQDLETMEDILNNPDLYTIDDFNYVTQNSENLNIYRDEMGLYHVEVRQMDQQDIEEIEEELEDLEEMMPTMDIEIGDDMFVDEDLDYEYDTQYSSEDEY